MNPDLDKLHAYPFERLAALKVGVQPPADRTPISLSIGEPRHSAPDFVLTAMRNALDGLSHYPLTRGEPALREVISQWLTRRFKLPAGSLDPERHVLPVSGTREALFAFAQAVVDRTPQPTVLMPNPFYQIYEGAALLAGAKPVYLNTLADNHFIPDFDAVPAAEWQRCQLLYLCSPGNPTGAVIDTPTLQRLIELAERHDFIIAADECYSEIYFDEQHPPTGLLQAAAAAGHDDYRRCVVFHSLSKRSNLPGLRSGFVAGDASIMQQFLKYRTYHGCAMPLHHQAASIAAWNDEQHVIANRDQYRAKFDAALEILSPVMAVEKPMAGFYLWPQTPEDDTRFARGLFADQNVTVLPGSYLSRTANSINPGQNRVRMALVASQDECADAARRITEYLKTVG
ncbi:MAG: succinyldiaminopimelate transaminase [Proteobacteria bacterium]|jgi:N-succinyldiaminopimelate aminotransferase|nr:succinyldiaminopimelate transaminase [Pseudomonadota bacterium]